MGTQPAPSAKSAAPLEPDTPAPPVLASTAPQATFPDIRGAGDTPPVPSGSGPQTVPPQPCRSTCGARGIGARREINQLKSTDDTDQERAHIVVEVNGLETGGPKNGDKGCVHVAIHEAIVLESVPMVPFLVDALHHGTGEVMCDAPPDENPALQTFTRVDRKQDAPQVSLASALLMHRKSGRLQGVADSAGQLLPGTQLSLSSGGTRKR